MPSIFTEGNVSFAEWERETLGSPNIERDGSFVVLAGERPAALALVKVDRQGRRAANEMTATLPEFRRQGLARLAKLATIRWAAENGITGIVTENDDENVGVRALNEELGYRPVLVRRVFLRDA